MRLILCSGSGNGQKGINNNYTGRWSFTSPHITGTVLKTENMIGKLRRFLAFDSVKGSLDFLTNRIQARGLYVGSTTAKIAAIHITNCSVWCTAYYKTWVQGNAAAIIRPAELKGLFSMYAQGNTLF